MAPIRIGIIGLPSTPSWSTRAHLPYLLKSSKYAITAVLNSSLESSQRAIKAHNLPSTVTAHGTPDSIASDPNVDLVVCTVRVDRHYETILPSVKAGKDLFVEWPLAHDAAKARELRDLAKSKGARTMVGLQLIKAPAVKAVQALLAGTHPLSKDFQLGGPISSTLTGVCHNAGPKEGENTSYIADRKVGGNTLTIHFGHYVAGLIATLGELKDWDSLLGTSWSELQVTDPDGKVLRTVKSDCPDQILVHGKFAGKHKRDVLFSVHLRGGAAFAPGEAFRWEILCEKGTVVVTGSLIPNIGSPDLKVRISTFEKPDEVKEVELEKDEWSELPQPAQNIARLYEAFAEGKRGEYWGFEEAVRRHELIEEMYVRDEKKETK